MTVDKILEKVVLGAVFVLMLGFVLAPYFAGTKTLNPVMLDLRWATVYWYGFLIVVGILVGYLVAAWYLAPARGLDQEHLLNIIIWALVGGLIGARLVFVILKWQLYAGSPLEILMLTHGGLSIHGAVLFGALGVWLYTRLARLDFWKVADILAPAVILGQVIGRFGNFVNQEAFGGPTDLPWKMFVAPAARPPDFINYAYFHPTFLYEAILGLVVLAFLLYVFYRNLKPGYVLAWYLILYSSLRFLTEFFRIDSDRWGMLTIAQWASLVIILLGIYIVYKRKHA